MILVTDVIYKNVPGNRQQLYKKLKLNDFKSYTDLNESSKILEASDEIVLGERFINENEEELIIGYSQTVCDILGVPLNCFDKLKKENIKHIEKINILNKEKNKISYEYVKLVSSIDTLKSSFWKRLKFLFTKEL